MIKVSVGDRIEVFLTVQTLIGAVVEMDKQFTGNELIQLGAIVKRRCIIYRYIDVSGYIPDDSFVKRKDTPFYIQPRE